MSPKRSALAYVVNSLNPGGTEKLVVEMALTFTAAFDVLVICLDEPGLWAKQLRACGISVYCMWRQPGLDVAIPVKLARHFHRHRARIIHAHQCTSWFYAALSRLIYPSPRLLLEEHGRFFPELENKKRVLVNKVLIKKLTHRFVAVSGDVRTRLQNYEGLIHSQIEVIYNGVKPGPVKFQDHRNDIRREFGFAPDSFVIGSVGRFDPIKNLPMFINSLARARQICPSIKGFLVGDGRVFNDAIELVDRLRLTDSVVFTGFREDARELVQCMDLFILSSFSEGTSMALLEAMAAGVSVAVTDVGGNPEIVSKGRTGWVVPSDSVADLTAAILDAIGNPAKRAEYAEAGRQRFEECFTFDRMIENYCRIYSEMLESKA